MRPNNPHLLREKHRTYHIFLHSRGNVYWRYGKDKFAREEIGVGVHRCPMTAYEGFYTTRVDVPYP